VTRRRLAVGFLAAALAVFLVLTSTRLFTDPAGAGSTTSVLAIKAERGRAVALERLDSGSLRPLGRSVPLRNHGRAWSLSPDRSRLVLARAGEAARSSPLSLRFVDLRGMRVDRDVPLTGEPGGRVRATAWVGEKHVLVLLGYDGAPGGRLLLVDAGAGGILRRRDLAPDRWVIGGAHTSGGFVLLLAPQTSIRPVRLLVVDRALAVRSVVLDRIRAGARQRVEAEGFTMERREPGLAVDSTGARAYVVGADEPVATVDLRSLRVAYRPLDAVRAPAVSTKSLEGPVRTAVWLGNGLVAVSGSTYGGLDERTRRFVEEPAGLHLLDTRTGTMRLIDPGASSVLHAGGMLVTHVDGRGLSGFDLKGRERWTALVGAQVAGAQVAGGGIVVVTDPGEVFVLDSTSGRVLARPSGPVPQLLSDAAPIW